jgi:hypothetical protein
LEQAGAQWGIKLKHMTENKRRMMTTHATNRDKAQEVYRLANDLWIDLVHGTRGHQLLSGLMGKYLDDERAAVLRVGFNRFYLFHIIMTLAKVSELYKENTSILPPACRDDFKKLVKSIEQRGILKFRNTVVGHLYDTETKRALTRAEVKSRAAVITQGDLKGFFLWVNNKQGNSYPTTVVSVLERVRDLIADEHKFSATDLK